MTTLRQLMKENNPYHVEYILPDIKGTKDILKFMLSRQKFLYGRTALALEGINYIILQTNIKRLISKYSDKDVVWAICVALMVCDRPFSTHKVEEILCDNCCPNT